MVPVYAAATVSTSLPEVEKYTVMGAEAPVCRHVNHTVEAELEATGASPASRVAPKLLEETGSSVRQPP